MNIHNQALLASDIDFYTVNVSLEGGQGRGSAGTYLFLCPPDIQVVTGDMVYVETKYGTTVGPVVDVGPAHRIDVNANHRYRWLFARVPLERLDELNGAVDDLIEDQQTAQFEQARRKMRMQQQALISADPAPAEDAVLIEDDSGPAATTTYS